jgi:hypothetical protein
VIAAFHIDVPPRIDAVVDDDVQPVAFAERRTAPRSQSSNSRSISSSREIDLWAEG